MLYPVTPLSRQDACSLVRRVGDDVINAPLRYPAVNLWQAEDAVTISADVPGVEPSDIDISVKENVVTFSGERKAVNNDEALVWHQRERAFGKFSRAFRMPFNLDPDKTEARVSNGVLEITLHRRDEDKPRRIEVKAA